MTATKGTALSHRWADLGKRMLSAAVMAAIGALELWVGGPLLALLAVALAGGMMWELARMTAPDDDSGARLLALLAAASVVAVLVPHPLARLALALPSVGLLLTSRREKTLVAAYALAVMLAVSGLLQLHGYAGRGVVFWLVMVVIASDVAGYFVGRIVGGPKFWPRISPKKTWSGTVAGWCGAALVGLAFSLAGHAHGAGPGLSCAGLVVLSATLAFAGQLGDIAESWIKRRVGIKDSSNLIPGHGGLLDRFDALIGATLALMVAELILARPFGG